MLPKFTHFALLVVLACGVVFSSMNKVHAGLPDSSVDFSVLQEISASPLLDLDIRPLNGEFSFLDLPPLANSTIAAHTR